MAHSASWPVTVIASSIAIASWTTGARAQSPVDSGLFTITGGETAVVSGTPAASGTLNAPLVITDSPSSTVSPPGTIATIGGISGTVTNASGGAPIQNVVVQVYNSTGTLVSSPSTDASGVYTVSGLAAGSYFGKTSNTQGYVDQLFSGKPCIGGFCSVTTGTPIAVTDGTTMQNINFALTEGGVITGTVRAAAGSAPIQGITLFAYTSSGSLIPGVNTTNAAGVYALPAMPPGNYFLVTSSQGFRDQPFLNYVDQLYDGITCPGRSCTITSGTPIGVTAGVTTSGINFSLAGGGIISGTVTVSGGSADFARATIYNSSGASVAYYLYINSLSGIYTVPGLPTGNYFAVGSKFGYVNRLYDGISCPANSCGVTTGTPIAVTAGSTTANVNFALVTSGTITGTVTNASGGASTAGVSAQIYNSSGSLVSTTLQTNTSGVYTAFGLSAGNYFVKTINTAGFLDQLYDGFPCVPSCTVTAGTPVAVTGGATTPNINFALTIQAVGPFADDPLTPGTPIKAVHVTEFRTRLNLVRARSGLAAFAYTNSPITAGTHVVMAVDILEMRTAMSQAYAARGLKPPNYSTSPGIGAAIVVADIADLRAALVAIE